MSITIICKKNTGSLYSIGDKVVITDNIDYYLKLLNNNNNIFSEFWCLYTDSFTISKSTRKYLNRKESIAT